MVEATSTIEESKSSGMITTHYIVEHFEEELSDWTLSEYVHMLLSLNKLYDNSSIESHKEVLVLTNFPFIAKLARD